MTDTMGDTKGRIGYVSVVIPVYNGERYLQQAIDSVLAQTYADVEIVVIDDGSTDSSPTMLREYGDRLRVYHQPNCGNVGLVRNTGIERSHGEFIAFLDQDDWWLPEKLSLQVQAMRSSDSIGLVHTAVTDFDDDGCSESGLLNPDAHPERIQGRCFEELLQGNPMYNSSVLVRRSALQKVGVCDLQIPGNTVQDYDLWLRIAKAFDFGFVSEPVTCYRMHSGQGMWNRQKMLLAELDVLLRMQDVDIWKSRSTGRYRLAKLYDEIATAYFEAADVASARKYFLKALSVGRSPRQLFRWGASLLPFPVIRAMRSAVLKLKKGDSTARQRLA